MQTDRIAYIDQVKIFLTCLVVAHHAAQAYGPTGGVWVVNDAAKAPWLKHFFFVNASFMMGLYFFISGYFMVFSIAKKTTLQFIKDRLKRLGIPLLFFTLFVFLPFNYVGAGANGNIFRFFINSYFYKAPIATGHLWFVAALLAFSFIYLILHSIFKKTAQCSGRQLPILYVFIYIVLLSVISALVRLQYPIDQWSTWIIPLEVAHLPQYLSLFLLGALFNHKQWLQQLTLKNGMLFLLLAIAAFIASKQLPASIANYWIMEAFIESLLCVGLSMFIISFFRHYMNWMNRFTSWLSDNAYGIYLFHLFVVIALQSLILNWQVNASIKFIAVSIGSVVISLIISALLRKIRFIRRII